MAASTCTTTRPKFFLFDAGVFRSLRPRGPLDRPHDIDGAALEGLVRPEDLRGLDAFGTDYPQAGLMLLYRGTRRERMGRVWILPVGDFLRALTPVSTLPVDVDT